MEKSRDNNFNIIRLLAAIMVMSGHMAYIMGGDRPILLGQEVHALGVKLFFLIGGYLITKSFESEPSVRKYIIKRFFRIWPPLVVAVLVTALFIAPIFSSYSLKEYYSNPSVLLYCVRNIMFFPVFSLPGVFENNPYPNAVNGSLWSLPIEVFMYIMVPIVVLTIFKKKLKQNFIMMFIFTSVFCIAQILHLRFFLDKHLIIYGSDLAQAMDLIPFYMIGMLFTFEDMKRYLNIQAAIILLILCSSIKTSMELEYLIIYTVFPYVIFSVALIKLPFFGRKFPSKRFEISYGLFLFGFPIQQCVQCWVMSNNITMTFFAELLISLLLTGILAYFMHNLVEDKCNKLSKMILRKIN